MAFIRYSSTTGAVNLSFAVMWVVIAVILVPSAVVLFYAQMPWPGLIMLGLAAFCVWPFRLSLHDGRAERRAYRAALADQAARGLSRTARPSSPPRTACAPSGATFGS